MVVKGNKDEGRATLRLWFSFRMDACKTETIVCDMVRLAPMLKLMRDFKKGYLRFQMGRVFLSKKSELTLIKRVPAFIGLSWVNSYAMNKCSVKKYALSIKH